MKIKVQSFIGLTGGIFFGVYVKRWWFPVWVRIDYWGSEEVAIKKATVIKHPKVVEIL